VTVLVVDDEEDAREALGAVLGRRGAKGRTASGAAQAALDLLARWPPDVLVSDIGMPGGDGGSHIRALAPDRGGRAPAAALTGYVSRRIACERVPRASGRTCRSRSIRTSWPL
jgi:CheY-like chemotaxis protein